MVKKKRKGKKDRSLSKERKEEKKKTRKMGRCALDKKDKRTTVSKSQENQHEDDFVEIDPDAARVAFDEDNEERTEMEVRGIEASDYEDTVATEDELDRSDFEEVESEGNKNEISFHSSRSRSPSRSRGKLRRKGRKHGKRKRSDSSSQSVDHELVVNKRISGAEKEEIVNETVGRMKSLLEGMFDKHSHKKRSKRSRSGRTDQSDSDSTSHSRSRSRSRCRYRRKRGASEESENSRIRRERTPGEYSGGEVFQSPSDTTIYRTAVKQHRSSGSSTEGLPNFNSSDDTIMIEDQPVENSRESNFDARNENSRDIIIDEFLSSERRGS